MQSLGLGALEDFDFIEPPDHRLVNDGRKLLVELGAMTEKGKAPLLQRGVGGDSSELNPPQSPFSKGGSKGDLTKIGQ